MLDSSYFQNSKNNVQIFTNAGGWSTWIKPRNAKFIHIFCVGAGGGGGGGFQVASGTKTGGGGGGGAGVMRANFQASALPDLLYIQCGVGGTPGTGGTSPTAGGSGSRSFVSVYPDSTIASGVFVASGTTAATGGAAGLASGNPAGGIGEILISTNVAIYANCRLVVLGTFICTNGQAGLASTTTVGGAPGFFTQSPYTIIGGGSSGGGDNTGGGFTGTGTNTLPIPSIAATALGSGANNAASGIGGLIYYKPFLAFIGGTGGGGIATAGTGAGGKGGDGAYGAGGGGGGGSFTSAGNGGKGGDGLIIITTIF